MIRIFVGESNAEPAEPSSQFQIATIVNRQEHNSPSQLPPQKKVQQRRPQAQGGQPGGQAQGAHPNNAQNKDQQGAPFGVTPLRGAAAGAAGGAGGAVSGRGRGRGRGGATPGIQRQAQPAAGQRAAGQPAAGQPAAGQPTLKAVQQQPQLRKVSHDLKYYFL